MAASEGKSGEETTVRLLGKRRGAIGSHGPWIVTTPPSGRLNATRDGLGERVVSEEVLLGIPRSG